MSNGFKVLCDLDFRAGKIQGYSSGIVEGKIRTPGGAEAGQGLGIRVSVAVI